MSVQSAKDFLKAIEENEELAAAIKDTDGEEAVAIAAEHGYEVTVEELREAVDELYGELSEEELANVAGGRSGLPMW